MAVEKGFIYLLTHPSDPLLVKVGKTVLDPVKRLRQHNTQLDKAAGRVVADTGQLWELAEYFEVPDCYNAESAFWQRPPMTELPGGGVEVIRLSETSGLDWGWVRDGLTAARSAGVRDDVAKRPSDQLKLGTPQALAAALKPVGINIVLADVDGKKKLCYRCKADHVFFVLPRVAQTLEACPICSPSSDIEARLILSSFHPFTR